jgi:hypothetical protein
MHHLSIVLVLAALCFAALSPARPSSASSPQVAPAAPTAQATVVSQIDAANPAVQPTPVVPQPRAPIGARTQQVMILMGATVLAALLIGGGVYLRRRWLMGGW